MPEGRRIRVLAVDDHDMVRRGLAAFLRSKSDLELAGEARDGQEAVALCEQLQPDVVLMDLVLPAPPGGPDMDGAAATRIIRGRWPHIQVLALTSFEEQSLVQEALQAGAIGYLLKNVSSDELAEAIRAAQRGRVTLAPEATRALIRASTEGPAPGSDLSEREREVLGLLVEGLSNPQIAQQLNISRGTARSHVSNILAKLGVSNRSEAIALALRQKLIR